MALLALVIVLGWSLLAADSSRAAAPIAPANAITVTLSPSSILADGTSTTTASASGFPIFDAVTFISSDPGETVGPTTVNLLTGVYSATITSSTTVTTPGAPVIITATDGTSSGSALLVQHGPPQISVQLANPSISVGGATTTATADVADALGNVIPGETVIFSATAGATVGPVQDNGDGTYTATITSSTTAGPVTVTATDTSVTPNVSGTATLIQTAGPATNVSIVLAPTSIPANGSSTTTATATVKDASGNLISTDTVVFVPSDPRDTVVPSPATNNHNGTYTATITSSTTAGSVQIVAVDSTTGAHAQTTLNQTPVPSTTGISVVPAQPVTNQTVTMVATVDVNFGPSSGTIAFDDGGTPISGCDHVSISTVGSGSGTAACQTSFAAVDSPVPVTAVFTPSAGNLGGSTSPADLVTVNRDSTTMNLAPSSSNPATGSTVTYLAAVVPKHAGAAQPTGSVKFTDGNKPLTGCASQPLLHGTSSSGAAAAVCRISFSSPGTHDVSAHFAGDASFTGSDSSTAQTVVHRRPPPPRLLATLQWSFFFAPSYTNVLLLKGNNVPAGASVQVKCHGHGCPFAKRTIGVSNAKSCKPTLTLRCTNKTGNTVALIGAFRRHRLRVGTQLRVEILRRGWIGKYYLFTVRARRAPSQAVSCLAPGSTRPGVGC